jgi:hypothetical protein
MTDRASFITQGINWYRQKMAGWYLAGTKDFQKIYEDASAIDGISLSRLRKAIPQIHIKLEAEREKTRRGYKNKHNRELGQKVA